jgi:hypothetical protein
MTVYKIYGVDDYGRKTDPCGHIKIEGDITDAQVIQKFLFNRNPGHWKKEEDIKEMGFYAVEIIGTEEMLGNIDYHRDQIELYKDLLK